MGVRPAVTVVIDVLSVEGLTEAQAGDMGEGVRQELARLMEAGGLPAGAAVSATVDGLTVVPDGPASTAAQVARVIYEQLAP